MATEKLVDDSDEEELLSTPPSSDKKPDSSGFPPSSFLFGRFGNFFLSFVRTASRNQTP
jgi:hypothetical protein